MNRPVQPRSRGRRDIIAIILLVLPLVALGYYLAAIEVAVDPPPDPVGESTPTVVATPGGNPAPAGTPSLQERPATPMSGTTRETPTAHHRAMATMSGTNRTFGT